MAEATIAVTEREFERPAVESDGSRLDAPHAIVAHEMNRLWQAHGIVDLVIHGIGDERADRPAIKPALRAAADVIVASINRLEPICTSDGPRRSPAVTRAAQAAQLAIDEMHEAIEASESEDLQIQYLEAISELNAAIETMHHQPRNEAEREVANG